MDTALKIARLTVLLSVAFACVALGIVNLQARMEMVRLSNQADAVVVKAGDEVDALHGVTAAVQAKLDVLDIGQANASVAKVNQLLSAVIPVAAGFKGTAGKVNDAIDLTSHRLNDLCPDVKDVDAAIRPCGSLADANRTLATLRGTSGQVEKSLLVFNQHEGELFTQESAAYAGMSKSVLDFDELVADPDLKTTVGNVETTTGNFAAMTTDGKDWLHAKLYPTRKRGFVSGLDATGDAVHHWMPSIF